MSLDFLNDETAHVLNGADLSAGTGGEAAMTNDQQRAILSSVDVAGIELRMLPPFIRDNHTLRIWPFPGYAKLYCLTMVVSDVANQLTGLMDLNAFPRIGRNESLPVNKTIYYWEKNVQSHQAPNQLHVLCSVIKSKGALRGAGDIINNAKNDNEYKALVDKLSSIVADTASFSAVANITTQIAGIVGRYMGKVDDRPIGTVVNSYTRLHGDWDKPGITPVHVATKNVDFGFELVIRDNDRGQRQAAENRLILPVLPGRDAYKYMMTL